MGGLGFGCVINAMQRFQDDCLRDGLEAYIWPLNDRRFRIGRIEGDGDYVLVWGLEDDEEALRVLPKSQFAVHMVGKRLEDGQRPTMGFVHFDNKEG